MTTSAESLRSLLQWWELAGVESAEAEAIMRAPTPDPGKTPLVAPSPARKSFTVGKLKPVGGANVAEDARAAAAAAQTLAELGEAIRSFDGCGLKRTAKKTVFIDGAETAPVLIFGEAPGRDEDAAGKPFVGRSGQLLDRMLESVGFSRKTNVLITNVIYWRPPGNRPPTQAEIAACLPFVERTVALAQPRLVVLAGGFAAQTVLKREGGVMRLRGKRLSHSAPELTDPVHAMVMLHPAYLLRRPQDKKLAWQDLLALAAWADELGIERGPAL